MSSPSDRAQSRRPSSLPRRRSVRGANARRAASDKRSSLLGLLPLLMSLALIPALLLVWFHLGDLHYLEIVSLSSVGAAGLGTVLLLGLFMLVYMTLCVALPSVFTAVALAQYGPERIPGAAVGAWAASAGLLAVVWFISALEPSFDSAFMFWPAHLAAGLLIGLWTLCAAYPRAHRRPSAQAPTPAAAFLRSPLVLGIGNGICGLLAFMLLVIPIKHLADDYATGLLPGWGQTALPLLIAFLLSLGPGLFYMWSNRTGAAGMNKRQLMVLMLIAAFVMLMISYSASREVRHLTLTAAGVVGSPVSPRLYRLPDNWNKQDEQIVADAFAPERCALSPKRHPAGDSLPARWICGYQNFSFGRARLICNHPYMDANRQFIKKRLICLLYIDNTLASLVSLPHPGPGKPAEETEQTPTSDGSPSPS